MGNILGYYVFHAPKGGWLHEDEKSWTSNFYEAAQFSSQELADDIAKRETGEYDYYVFACMGSVG